VVFRAVTPYGIVREYDVAEDAVSIFNFSPEDGSSMFLQKVLFFCKTTRCHSPEYHNLNNHRPENLTPIYILWHVEPFLGNDREISSYTTAIAR
jgi:hypothetical protein